MISLANLAQTSTKKLTSLLNSHVSSSLRMEVLINNLLSSLEKGEPNTTGLHFSYVNSSSHTPKNPSKLRFPQTGNNDADDVEDEDEDNDDDDETAADDDVPSPAYDEISESEEDHDIHHSSRILRRCKTVENSEHSSEERKAKAGKNPGQKIDPYDNLSIEVVEDGSSWHDQDIVPENHRSLTLRIRLPNPDNSVCETLSAQPSSSNSVDPFELLDPPEPLENFEVNISPKKRSLAEVEGVHEGEEASDPVPQFLADEILPPDEMVISDLKSKVSLILSPKKKLRLVFDEREQNRKP